jgi:sulfur-oxidizing protein SoxY
MNAVLALGRAASAEQSALPQANPAQADQDPWPTLAPLFFGEKAIQDGAAVLSLEAPYRALDAAVVPMTIRLLPREGDARAVRRVSLVIDGNPSPLAATFTLGEHSGIDALSTRVRVDDYTNVHAVAELSDGSLYAVSRFVKAAGGCSAPALKQTAGAVPLGTMRWRELKPAQGNTPSDAPPGDREAQLMIRHPNFSGMQMDQVTRLYIPAEFIKQVEIRQGTELVVLVEGGIALSENPEFRFRFKPGSGDAPFRVDAVASDGKQFKGEWKPDAAS